MIDIILASSLASLLVAIWILAMALGVIDGLDYNARQVFTSAATSIIAGTAMSTLAAWRLYRDGTDEDGPGGETGS
jgi:uncharacterized membrane protein YbhN (UPF0104 family)